MNSKIFVSLLFLLVARNLSPQVVEEFAESIDEFSESSQFLDQIDALRKNPVNLNLGSMAELLRLPWLTSFMAREIIDYRKSKGGIRHLSELESLLGFDSRLIERMSEFVVIGPPKRLEKEFRVEERSRLKVPPQSETDYLGNRNKLYTRVGVSVQERYSLGFLVEKDAYERSYTDFTSYFMQLGEFGILRRAIAGHYNLEFGEGLIFSPVDFSIKSQGAIKKGNRGILPARSSDENRSLLGGALAFSLANVKLFGFFSSRSLDANLHTHGDVRSLYESGLHRTRGELEKKDVLTERLVGGRLEVRAGSVGSGLTFYSSKYSRSFDAASFSGSEYRLVGVDLAGRLKKAKFFGEAAFSTSGGSGALVGARLSARRFSTGFLLRSYGYNFWSPHSSSFSEYDDENESGAYCFTTFSTATGTRMEAYVDIFKTTRSEEPGEFPCLGNELQISLYQKISKTLKSQVRYRKKVKSEKLRESLRLQLDAGSGKLKMRIRVEFSNSRSSEGDERGTGDMEYINLRYKPSSSIELEGRIALFSIESYDARIYMYERDLPGYLRNVALSGEGKRSYLLLRYTPTPWFELTLKYANQRKEEIREEFGLQLDLLNTL